MHSAVQHDYGPRPAISSKPMLRHGHVKQLDRQDGQGRRRWSRPSKMVKAVEDGQGRRRWSRPLKMVKMFTAFTTFNALTALTIFQRTRCQQPFASNRAACGSRS